MVNVGLVLLVTAVLLPVRVTVFCTLPVAATLAALQVAVMPAGNPAIWKLAPDAVEANLAAPTGVSVTTIA